MAEYGMPSQAWASVLRECARTIRPNDKFCKGYFMKDAPPGKEVQVCASGHIALELNTTNQLLKAKIPVFEVQLSKGIEYYVFDLTGDDTDESPTQNAIAAYMSRRKDLQRLAPATNGVKRSEFAANKLVAFIIGINDSKYQSKNQLDRAQGVRTTLLEAADLIEAHYKGALKKAA